RAAADEERVRHRLVVPLPLLAQIRSGEGEKQEPAERYRSPQHPRPELAPARIRAIGDDAHDRVEQHAADETAPEDDGRGRPRRNLEYVRVEEGEERDERLEDQVGR